MKRPAVLILLSMVLAPGVFAEGMDRVPALLNFQGQLVDEGGNPLPNGATSVRFMVTDEKGSVLYEETQSVDVADGQISAIVGNGLDASSGAPTGGVPPEIFFTDERRFLQLEVPGQRPYDGFEIVSVPYAVFSETTLKLADGALTGRMIGRGIIEKEHLSDELISYLGRELRASSAGGVSVSSGLIYSGSGTVQGVLKDLDMAIKRRDDEIEWAKKDYTSKLADESSARKSADAAEEEARKGADLAEISARQSAVSNEAIARSNADNALQSSLNAEAASRGNADSSLQSQINSHSGATSVHGSDGAVVGMNTLNSRIAALQSPITDISQQLTAFAKLQTGNYRGNWSGGIDGGQYVTVGFRPKFLLIGYSNGDGTGGSWALLADLVSPDGIHYTRVIAKNDAYAPTGVTIGNSGFTASGNTTNNSSNTYNWTAVGK